MVALSVGLARARQPSSFILFLLFIIVFVAQVSVAQDSTTDGSTTTAATTADTSSTTDSTTTSSDDSTTTSAATTTDSSSSSTTDATSTSTDSSSSSSSTSGYPIVTVPPTADAPYMQKSKIPEGTLFIVVGAVLGAIGFAILAWRALVAWSVNRSVRQAAMVRSSETKGLLRTKKRRSRSRRSTSGPGVTLEKLGGGGHQHHHRHSHRHHKSPSTKTPSSNSALFFSPTAGMHRSSSSNRRSAYLPAGYYNTGSAAPPRTHEARFSAADLPGMGPQTQGYTRAKSAPSPPESPGLSPAANEQDTMPRRSVRRSRAEDPSTSSVNLSSPPQGRTPSAYLEDLFDNPSTPQNRH
ncbi:hypothetical protein ASPBRDRAFT_48656 [Aspergillus brasiliensis CBS 101740]|uniref:REJ domain-containing protein n=1 Tax=Aspergillus brasiliensis (strain CBS 101740 / IMI 381727 / IBT 21946) TaxID=767769 RepID=A0A1L9U4W5_ASPBC|nr:hypothetical protein ASPBRDRAFT_48656 [Aspergillus brasiliensis CBS 101740]